MERIKILIADDHPILSAGLKMYIDEWDEFEVCGMAENGDTVVRLAKETKPALVIMDLKMPFSDGVSAIKTIKKKLPDTKILAFTTFDDDKTIKAAVASGCDGFLLKVIEPETLRNSLNSIMEGVHVYDKTVVDKLRSSYPLKPDLNLSDRERLILTYICDGLTNAEIGEKLYLSAGTVKNLISLLLNKTNCVSRSQLASFTKDHDLLS